MKDVSRRGLLGWFGGMGTVLGTRQGIAIAAPQVSLGTVPSGEGLGEPSFSWARVELLKRGLVGEIGDDAYDAWFAGMNVEGYKRGVLYVSVPVAFIKRWVEAHYGDNLLRAAQRVDGKIGEVRVSVREPPIGS